MKRLMDTGYMAKDPRHRLKSVQKALRMQGYVCSAKLTSEGKPYLSVCGYKILFFGRARYFRVTDQFGTIQPETFYGAGWTAATKIATYLNLTKAAPGLFDEDFCGYHEGGITYLKPERMAIA